MRAATTTLLTFLIPFTAGLPASNLPRAGGPAIKPIPSTCSVTNPYPNASPGAGFLPAPAAQEALFYSAYYPSPSTNKTQLSEQCLQQCYGYGNSVECKGAFWAENVIVPEGNRGAGALLTACLFYDRALTETDFTAAPSGQGTDAFTRNIAC